MKDVCEDCGVKPEIPGDDLAVCPDCGKTICVNDCAWESDADKDIYWCFLCTQKRGPAAIAAENARLRERAERAEHDREVMIKTMVEHDPLYPKAPWVVNKPWGYRLPYRWYPTEAEARAAAYLALGLDPATAPRPKESR